MVSIDRRYVAASNGLRAGASIRPTFRPISAAMRDRFPTRGTLQQIIEEPGFSTRESACIIAFQGVVRYLFRPTTTRIEVMPGQPGFLTISADTVPTAGHYVVAGFSPRSFSEHCVHRPA